MEAIRAQGFSFSYPDAKTHTVGPLDWHVAMGSFTLLVGATGCGKTTLLRCLKPSLVPTGACCGTLEVLGQPTQSFSALDGAALVGYVAQSPENQLICDTVWHELAFGMENIGLAPETMRRRVAEVAHFFGIEPWFHAQVSDLSGGQQQMVNLAAVLALQPKLLILDEPTAQLDPVAEKNFLHALFRVNRELGITVVVATHAPETMASYATGCVELVEGCLHTVDLGRFSASLVSDEGRGVGRSAGLFERDVVSVFVPQAGGATNPPALSVHDVYFRFARDATWVLRGLDVNVRKGSIHAIVGGNGSGKSTLLRLVAGVIKPERGRVGNRLASRQALLPQNPKTLFACDTVAEELREWQDGCGYDDRAIDEALERFGLGGQVAQHPYDLSGGQQQLLALAKILLSDPELLLLDEPTKGLDPSTKIAVAEAIIHCSRQGNTIVFVTHDLMFASCIAHTTTMLFDGEVACTEPTDAFFAQNLFYRPVEDAFLHAWRAKAAIEEDRCSGAHECHTQKPSSCVRGLS